MYRSRVGTSAKLPRGQARKLSRSAHRQEAWASLVATARWPPWFQASFRRLRSRRARLLAALPPTSTSCQASLPACASSLGQRLGSLAWDGGFGGSVGWHQGASGPWIPSELAQHGSKAPQEPRLPRRLTANVANLLRAPANQVAMIPIDQVTIGTNKPITCGRGPEKHGRKQLWSVRGRRINPPDEGRTSRTERRRGRGARPSAAAPKLRQGRQPEGAATPAPKPPERKT